MTESKSGTREDQLQELSDFIERTQKEIIEIASALNWSIETVVNDNETFLTCPYDSSHRVCKESLEKHLASCQWRAEGYKDYDLPFSEPAAACGPKSCIKFDAELQDKVLRMAKEQNPEMKIGSGERLIPRTSDRLLTDFTSDERKALYDYVVSNTAKPEIGPDIADIHQPKSDEKKSQELSFLEVLVQKRNLKRRSAKHRGVHTNKKSHTEILREVINQQMEMYTSYLEEVHAPSSTPATSSREQSTVLEEFEEESWQKDSRQYDLSFKQSYGYRSSHSHERHSRSGDRYSHRSKEYEYGERSSPKPKDSRKHRKHEHRRSRSPSRRHAAEEKHRSTKHESHRKKHKSRDSEKSDGYSRRNGDRRKERDRY